MYFKQIDEIVRGEKTQTRRVCKENELLMYLDGKLSVVTFTGNDPEKPRLKWQVGRDYAVSPGRGKPGAWWMPSISQWTLPEDHILRDPSWRPLRIRILEIRREPLREITREDAIAEGIVQDGECWRAYNTPSGYHISDPRVCYFMLWDSVNTRAPYRWKDSPDVWALTFEVVRD